MKKCASCSKDLPDAALHCVFCGAKQAPAPAQAAGLAKTVMGNYSAQEMLAQMRQQGVPAGTPGAGAPPSNLPSAAPYSAPPAAPAYEAPPVRQAPISVAPPPSHAQANAATMFDTSAASRPPVSATPASSGFPNPATSPGAGNAGPRGNVDATLPPQGFPQGFNPAQAPRGNVDATMPPQGFPQGFNPAHAPRGNVDATMPPQGFPQGFNPAQAAQAQVAAGGVPHGHAPAPAPAASPYAAQVFGPSSGPIPAHPAQPGYGAPNPYAGGPAPGQMPYAQPPMGMAGNDPLRSVGMWTLLFGIFLVVEFVLPVSLDPLEFSFTHIGQIFDANIGDILGFFMMPVIGVLAIVFGVIPMGTAARGAAAGALGVSGFAILLAFSEHMEWQGIARDVGTIALLAGLCIRGGYPQSMLSRILVTIGALAVLAPSLIPSNGGGVPLVDELTTLTDGTLIHMVPRLIGLARIALVVASLLAWLPGPGTAGAKVFYWLLLGSLAVEPLLMFGLDDPAELIKHPALMFAWAPYFSLFGLASYGLGALLGKSTSQA